MVDKARSQLGIKEATGKNDGIPATRYMGGDTLPWCAGFVLWVYKESGLPLPGNWWKNRAVNALFKTMRESGMETKRPALGGLVFFHRDHSAAGPTGHVEIVVDIHKDGYGFTTVGGNVGNAVRKSYYSRLDKRIAGFADPFADGGHNP